MSKYEQLSARGRTIAVCKTQACKIGVTGQHLNQYENVCICLHAASVTS